MRGLWKNWTTGQLDSDPCNLASKFDMKAWSNRALLVDLPAELASLKALYEYQEKAGGKVDRLVFLHSDRGESLQAYQVLREIIVGENLFPDTPVDRIEDWPIRGLDPANAAQFGEALQQIWTKLVADVNSAGNNDEFIFNLTGGYKALSVVLGGYAYIDRGYPRIKVAYLYEGVDSGEITFVGFSHEGSLNDRLKVTYVDADQKPHDVLPPVLPPP